MATGWAGTNPATWAGNASAMLTALLRNSVQELAKEASRTVNEGGRVPVKTGNLSRSVVVDNQPPRIIEGLATGDYSLGIAAIVPGDTIYIGWQAKYARRQNYGFVGADSLGRVYNQSGYGFAEATAAKWPSILAAQAAKLGGR
jgi:hypothetical protein